MTVKFKDIEKGKVVLIDKLYGVKVSDNVLLVKNSGANGTIEVEPEQEFELTPEDFNNDNNG